MPSLPESFSSTDPDYVVTGAATAVDALRSSDTGSRVSLTTDLDGTVHGNGIHLNWDPGGDLEDIVDPDPSNDGWEMTVRFMIEVLQAESETNAIEAYLSVTFATSSYQYSWFIAIDEINDSDPPIPGISEVVVSGPPGLTYSVWHTYTMEVPSAIIAQMRSEGFANPTWLVQFGYCDGVDFTNPYTNPEGDPVSDVFYLGYIGLEYPGEALEEGEEPDSVELEGSGGVVISGDPTIILSQDVSGLYTLNPAAHHDTLYARTGSEDTIDVEIPNPFIELPYVG